MNVRLRRDGPLAVLLASAALGVLVGAGALVTVRTHVTSLRYELMKLQEASVAAHDEVEKLRVEAAALAAPDRLEKRAIRLGLRFPEPGQVSLIHLSRPETQVGAGGVRP